MTDTTTEIRSYRAVFDLERRIYRIDRLRLNPSGVPVRGIVYCLTLLASLLALGRLPPAALLLGALPWYLAYVVLPGAGAALLTVLRIDGRPAHLTARALLRHWLGPRSTVALGARGRAKGGLLGGAGWRPPEILLLPDGSEARMRRLRYTGPGAVLVSVAHERRAPGRRRGRGRRELGLSEGDGPRASPPGQVIALAARAALRVG